MSVDLIDHYQGQDLSYAGDGAQQAEENRIMVARLLEHLPLELQENAVIEIEELDVGLDTLADHGIGEGLAAGGEVPVQQDRAVIIRDAQTH